MLKNSKHEYSGHVLFYAESNVLNKTDMSNLENFDQSRTFQLFAFH